MSYDEYDITKMFIVRHDDHDYGTETRDQEPKDDFDSPSCCQEDGKLGLDSVVCSVTLVMF
jgi:hypothetical protein